MENKLEFPLIKPLLEKLNSQGLTFTDKAVQSLNLAAHDAKDYEYRQLYDDNLFTGIIRSQSIATSLFQTLGINILEILEDVHAPLEPSIEYRKTYSETRRSLDKKRRHLKPISRTGKVGKKVEEDAHFLLKDLSGEITSKDLLIHSLDFPAVWKCINNYGISVNKVRHYINHLMAVEPDIESQKFVIEIDNNKFSFNMFDLTTGLKLYSSNNNIESVPLRLNIITPRQSELSKQVEEFEWLINKSNVSEYDIQVFLEKHPKFLLGIEYKTVHSQLTLTRGDQKDLKPDFFLERINGNFCDILDLKLPQAKLVVGKSNRRTFSSSVISALGQLREYRNYFDDISNRKLFNTTYKLMAYKPKIQVLIGRSSDFRDELERKVLEDELKNLEILTFDDILTRVKQQLRIME